MFSILNEIKDNSHFNTTSVVLASIGSAASTYILVAITGYLSFGDSVSGNIVGMYPPGLWATIGRGAIVILVMFSYPLQCHPCRASVDAVLRWRPKSVSASLPGTGNSTSADTSPHRHPLLGPRGGAGGASAASGAGPSPCASPSSSRPAEPMSDLRFSLITTTILILSYIAAMTVSSLDAVLSYVGSTGSTSISFILPGLFYYKISSPDSPTHQRLLKEDDDEADLDVSAAAVAAAADETADDSRTSLLRRHVPSRLWRKTLLRKLSLGLVGYGVLVMVVTLTSNIMFSASH